ncbi:hypothetical protein JD844_007594 [Phrynosoma platyrhinos]|uniref:Uncharacterized protein n=1 Tax=Phrynosoma platyrhinos TaxID=52577 RepID=A0ABQ7T3M2_PHRPL|nr:hypothetical protein JD844_007594 [Phrynosoma platyrhinos]
MQSSHVIPKKRVQQQNPNNSPVIPANQYHNSNPKQLMPTLLTASQSNSSHFSHPSKPYSKQTPQPLQALDHCKKDYLGSIEQVVLPVIKVSMPSPQKDPKKRPILVNAKNRLGYQEPWKKNNNVKYYKGSRSQGCSPERQTRLEVRCASSPHLPESDKPPLSPYKTNKSLLEHNGDEERKYFSPHLYPHVITSSRSTSSLNNIMSTHDDLILSVSNPASFWKTSKMQADRRSHHASLECVLEFQQLPTQNFASAQQALLLPFIKVSMPSPQADSKTRPVWTNSEARLGFQELWKKNNNMKTYKGCRSQGCSPERQTRLDVGCVSSSHLTERGKPPLPPNKINMKIQDHDGPEGKRKFPAPPAKLYCPDKDRCHKVEERSRLNRQSSPAMPHKVANRISDPNLPPRSESFSISGVQPARTPPMLRPVDPQIPHLVSVKSQGPSLPASQSLHEQPTKGMAGFQEALTVTSHRTEMPRQNSDPTSENPPLPPRVEKFDRSSWLRQEEDIPPKVKIVSLLN